MNSKLNRPVRQWAQSVVLGLLFLGCQVAFAQTYTLWVDAARGNDVNDGTAGKPLQTLGRAIALAHAIPDGVVSIKLKPGTYPVAANTIIRRDHIAIEGLSNPVLDANGLLDHFASPVNVVPADLGDQNLWLNLLFVIRASNISISGLSFDGRGINSNGPFYTINFIPFQFEGQWPSPQDPNFAPRALTGESIRLCSFNTWLQASGFNYASGTAELCKVENCFVGFYTGPSPGGAVVHYNRNHFSGGAEASIQACGTPEFCSAPNQPASLAVNVSGNLFENTRHISVVELYIRDYTPSAMDQPGSLDAQITGNTFRNNNMADLNIVDLSRDHLNSHWIPNYNATTPPVTVHMALARNSFQGPEFTGQFSFQEFTDLYDANGNPLPDYPWISHFVQNATAVIDDPENELADCANGTRAFQYRVRQTDNDFLYWNGKLLNAAFPNTGFGVTVPPCP